MAASTPLPIDPIAEAKRQWLDHGWTDAAPGMAAVTSLMRAQQIVLSHVEAALKPYALSFARYEMLRLLAFTRTGELPMSSAVARLQVHPTSVTKTVDRLVLDGLVARAPHPTDGRATLLRLTDRGRTLVDEATETLNSEVFARPMLAGEDIAALVSIIARMRRNAGDFSDPRPAPDPL